MYSTKLETPISNFEVAMDDTYEDVNDPAITVAFDLSVNGEEYANTSILVWTTTPWTIPVNIRFPVGPVGPSLITMIVMARKYDT